MRGILFLNFASCEPLRERDRKRNFGTNKWENERKKENNKRKLQLKLSKGKKGKGEIEGIITRIVLFLLCAHITVFVFVKYFYSQ